MKHSTPLLLSLLFCLTIATNTIAQINDSPNAEEPMHDVSLVESPITMLPYEEIHVAPEDYTSGNIVSRMIDGLGFRYHWASDNLREEDLAYRPTAEASSTLETLEHIYGLSNTIYNAVMNKPNIRSSKPEKYGYEELREKTLVNLKEASDHIRGMTAEQVADLKIINVRNGKETSSAFWHLLNGPMADAIYHTGQVVSFRRTSGNPVRSGINLFRGTVKK